MKSTYTIRTNPRTGDQLKEVSEYMGKSMNTNLSLGQTLEIMVNRVLFGYQKDCYQKDFFYQRTDDGWIMSEEGMEKFVKLIDRAELDMAEYPGTYLKAVQVTLHVLGFDPDWIERDLWRALANAYLKDRQLSVAHYTSMNDDNEIRYWLLIDHLTECFFVIDDTSASSARRIAAARRVKMLLDNLQHDIHLIDFRKVLKPDENAVLGYEPKSVRKFLKDLSDAYPKMDTVKNMLDSLME